MSPFERGLSSGGGLSVVLGVTTVSLVWLGKPERASSSESEPEVSSSSSEPESDLASRSSSSSLSVASLPRPLLRTTRVFFGLWCPLGF